MQHEDLLIFLAATDNNLTVAILLSGGRERRTCETLLRHTGVENPSTVTM